MHNKELHDLFALPDIIMVISQKESDIWGMYDAWERTEKHAGFWYEHPREHLGVGGREI